MLSLNSISFSFGKTEIFKDLNLDFQSGKIYGIVGANGVGKTTLFRSIAQLYNLKNGEIQLHGQGLQGHQVSFLPTEPYFYPYMKGKEYLKIVQNENDLFEKSCVLAQVLNVPLDQLVDTYSTGMKKKLAFVARYIQNKEVSIYDEPFNGVDLESNEVLQNLWSKTKQQKITLISSHILSMLFELCDEIIHIEKNFRLNQYFPDEFPDLKSKIRSSL